MKTTATITAVRMALFNEHFPSGRPLLHTARASTLPSTLQGLLAPGPPFRQADRGQRHLAAQQQRRGYPPPQACCPTQLQSTSPHLLLSAPPFLGAPPPHPATAPILHSPSFLGFSFQGLGLHVRCVTNTLSESPVCQEIKTRKF